MACVTRVLLALHLIVIGIPALFLCANLVGSMCGRRRFVRRGNADDDERRRLGESVGARACASARA